MNTVSLEPVGQQERLQLTLEGIGRLGEAYGYCNGELVYVFGGIPGEEVVVEVVRRRKKYIAAQVVEVMTPSPYRVEPPCPLFGPCTGCQWQHIDYSYQLELKRQAIEKELSGVPEFEGVSVSSTLPSPQVFQYRNHARFTVGQEGALGYVNRTTRRFVSIASCMLMHPWINDTLGELQGRCGETTQLSVRYGINTGEWLIQPRLENAEISISSGQTHYGETLLDRRFRIASPSFFQVNTKQAEKLVDLVRVGLRLSGDEVLVDVYAGVGTFAVLLAPYASKVIAIEESASAVKDAAINTLGLDNVAFLQGRSEDMLDTLDDSPDALILDPPRVGCHPRALEAVGRLAPKRIAYVSCDPETLARDLRVLCQGPFRLEDVQPIDMFPQTYHIECVATLSRRV